MILTTTGLIKVLLIEDNRAEARLLQEILKEAKLKHFSLVHVNRLGEALKQLQTEDFDAILLDLTLPDSQGLDSLNTLVENFPSLPIIVLTNNNDDDLALEAVRRGAQDYIVKRRVNLEFLVKSICYAIERKQMAEQLREMNQKLEQRVQQRTEALLKAQELNQLKAEFVSMLSHDFRNPLNTILLSTGLLESSSDKLTREQQLSYFNIIRNAIKSMDQLLTEVLLIGRADSGKLRCYGVPLALDDFCFRLVKSLQINLEQKQQIIFTPQGQLNEGVWDGNLLEHILNNLLNNALKYSPGGSMVKFDLIGEQEQVIFRIQDQGIGIPPEDREHLFNPFYRANNVENIPGTGLGLAIVQRCVEAHGGQIALDSQVGVGTTFTVTLPIRQEGVRSQEVKLQTLITTEI